MLNVIDEFTHECLAIRVARKLKAIDVIDVLSDLFILRGVPGHIRSDNGPEFVAKAVQEWITAVGAKTAYITPGSPWENGYVESFNARLRDELLDGEIFYTLREAQIVIESWRRHFNTIRPHESLDYKPPAPEVFVPAFAAWPPPVELRRCETGGWDFDVARFLTMEDAKGSSDRQSRALDDGVHRTADNFLAEESMGERENGRIGDGIKCRQRLVTTVHDTGRIDIHLVPEDSGMRRQRSGVS